jgi:hypothetical protein
MRPEHPSQTPEKSDEDRLRQIEEDLCLLTQQLLKIQERHRYAQALLNAAPVSPP